MTETNNFRSGVTVRARLIALLCIVGLCLPLLSPYASAFADSLRFAFDLAVHWQVLYASLLAVAVLAWAWASKRWLVLVLLALSAFPYFTAHSRTSLEAGTTSGLRVAVANVHLDSNSPESLLRWLTAEGVEVVVLHEVSEGYASELKAQGSFRYMHLAPRSDPFGMAILSRAPLRNPSTRKAFAGDTPVLEATIEHLGREVRIVAVHPMPPLTASYAVTRDDALILEAMNAGRMPVPALIVGDFNATVWSPAFSQLKSAGWSSAAPMTGTWPSVVPTWFGVGLDHVLMDKKWILHESRIGPSFDSDHRLVLVDVSLRQ